MAGLYRIGVKAHGYIGSTLSRNIAIHSTLKIQRVYSSILPKNNSQQVPGILRYYSSAKTSDQDETRLGEQIGRDKVAGDKVNQGPDSIYNKADGNIVNVHIVGSQKSYYRNTRKIDSIPVLATHSVERKQPLQKIRSLFSENSIVTLIGHSATGKTELAKQYGRTFRDSYKHVWFVDTENLEGAYRNLATEWQLYDLKTIDSIDIDALIFSVHSEFSKRRFIFNQKSLILFDNAFAGFIGEKLKGNLPSNTDILITSKSSDWATTVDLVKDEQHHLTPEEGLEILRRWIPKEKYDEREAQIIVNSLSNLPVVIAQAGNFIANSRFITMANFLREFAKNKKEILSQGKLINPQDKGYIEVYTSVKMTMQELAETEPQALELLSYCAYLPGKGIPIALLLKLFGSESLLLNRCLNTLGTLIIDIDSTITIHELFQEIVVEESQRVKTQLLAQLAQASLDFGEFLSTNLKKALMIYQQGLKESEKNHGDLKTAIFASRTADVYTGLVQYPEALLHHQKALKILRKALGEDHPDTATNYNNVGGGFRDLGRHEEALQYLLKALEILKKALGEDHPVTAASYNNVGMSFSDLGRHAEALQYKQKALEIKKKALGEDHPDTATSYNNVGSSFGDLRRHAEALEYQQKALEIRKKALGEDHHDTAASYNNVGVSFSDQGRYAAALQYKQKALQIRRKALGEDHLDTAKSYNNVGLSFRDLGRHAEALEYLQKALEIRRKALGEDHPDTATSYNNVGASFIDLGRHEEAQQCLQKALEIRRKALGEDHPDTATSYNNVGVSFIDLGRHEEAQQYQQKAQEIMNRISESQNSKT